MEVEVPVEKIVEKIVYRERPPELQPVKPKSSAGKQSTAKSPGLPSAKSPEPPESPAESPGLKKSGSPSEMKKSVQKSVPISLNLPSSHNNSVGDETLDSPQRFERLDAVGMDKEPKIIAVIQSPQVETVTLSKKSTPKLLPTTKPHHV